MERADGPRPIKTILQKYNKTGLNSMLNSASLLEVVIMPCIVSTQRCATDVVSTITATLCLSDAIGLHVSQCT